MILKTHTTDFFALDMEYPDSEEYLRFSSSYEEERFYDQWDLRLYDLKIVTLANQYLEQYRTILFPSWVTRVTCPEVDHASVTVGVHYASRLNLDIELLDSWVQDIPLQIDNLSKKHLSRYAEFLAEYGSSRSCYAAYTADNPEAAAYSIRVRRDHWEANVCLFLLWEVSVLKRVQQPSTSWRSFVYDYMTNCDPYQFTSADLYENPA